VNEPVNAGTLVVVGVVVVVGADVVVVGADVVVVGTEVVAATEVVVLDVELGPLELPHPTPAKVKNATTMPCRACSGSVQAVAPRSQRSERSGVSIIRSSVPRKPSAG
jgi:hypothetical protein